MLKEQIKFCMSVLWEFGEIHNKACEEARERANHKRPRHFCTELASSGPYAFEDYLCS
jgi:hypothetical protein